MAGFSTPSSSANSVHVLISLDSSFLSSSNNTSVLKFLTSLLGGELKFFLKSVVSMLSGNDGLQYRINATYAFSKPSSSVASRDGRERSLGRLLD